MVFDLTPQVRRRRRADPPDSGRSPVFVAVAPGIDRMVPLDLIGHAGPSGALRGMMDKRRSNGGKFQRHGNPNSLE
ncbi:MAG TPA: hypothetical protein VNJ12_02990 [Candidatus Dormibacteraeota bacterium]|nr:hypothetical protein [Candidatus Dormibacteraeota bacterium]